MSVHGLVVDPYTWSLILVTSSICLAGLYRLVVTWGHGSPRAFISAWRGEAFRNGARAFLRVLALDVLLLRRVWRRSRRRWAVHMAMFWVFLILGAFLLLSALALVLAYLDPNGLGGASVRFLKGLQFHYSVLGYLLVAASGCALVRRLVVRTVRRRTRFWDLFLVGTIFSIGATGMVAEWFSGFDILAGAAMTNWDLALQVMSWHIWATFLLFVMVLPWTRLRHIVTAPLLLLARRGGE
jgi:heterodisulfide reductase subunit E